MTAHCCQRLKLADEAGKLPPFIDGCNKMKQVSGAFIDLGHFIRLHECRRWSLRLACSTTTKSGLKSPSPSCTIESKSPIRLFEHCAKTSASNTPTNIILSRSVGLWDVASFFICSNRSRTESSSGFRFFKSCSN
jgi:hypothetical protein